MTTNNKLSILLKDGTEIDGTFLEMIPDPIFQDKENIRIVCDDTGERAVVNHRWVSSVKVA